MSWRTLLIKVFIYIKASRLRRKIKMLFVIALPEDRGFLTNDHSFTKNVEEALIFNHEDDVHLYIKQEADRFDTWVKENDHLLIKTKVASKLVTLDVLDYYFLQDILEG